MKSGFPTVVLLALVGSIAMSASPMMMLIGSIIGARMASSELWATLPIALMVIGTACGVLPAVQGMARLGRKRTFFLFIGLGTAATLVAGHALAVDSFFLFCLGAALLGTANAALHQIRFAAMEAVNATLVEQPAAQVVLQPENVGRYDAVFFYDMCGIAGAGLLHDDVKMTIGELVSLGLLTIPGSNEIADDSKSIRMYLREILREIDATVTEAVDGLGAYKLIKNNKYDLVFMDINMPNHSGLEVIEKVRNTLKIKNLPIIVIDRTTNSNKKI